MTTTVVTGLGVIAPTGLGVEDYWKATLEGRNGIAPITKFDASGYPSSLAGQVVGFHAADHLPGRLLPQTDHMTRMALAAAQWAWDDAGLDPAQLPEFSAGVVTASSSGGYEFGERELRNLWAKGASYVSAYQSFAWFYAVNTGQISIRHQMRGPTGVLVSDQAGGADAIAHARRQIRKGARVMLAGGVDSSLCSWGWIAHLASGRVSTADDPRRAYLPFSADARGHVPGEGGALLVLEEETAARARGARIYGVVAGHAATLDPPPGSGRPSTLEAALRGALADADVHPDEVDVVFCDGAAIPELDRIEAAAINAVFGEGAVPVTVPKTMTGRLFSGAVALDAAAALLSIRDGVIPPTINATAAPDLGLDLVTETPRSLPVRIALIVARGVGGFNSALVLRAA